MRVGDIERLGERHSDTSVYIRNSYEERKTERDTERYMYISARVCTIIIHFFNQTNILFDTALVMTNT